MYQQDTIAAIATPPGTGGVAMIRLSGPKAFEIAGKLWTGRKIDAMKPNTTAYGTISDSRGEYIDDVVIAKFVAPHSFTAEDTIEISCHGSEFIQRQLLGAIIDAGARIALPGEFSQRAFINGRIDLAQAEGIADLIAASSKAAHKLAVEQIRGHFSQALETLREKLKDLGALLELELDFSEEDVEFADRSHLDELTAEIITHISKLTDSYRAGKVIKEGIPTAIAGVPNAGKSTLLNALLGDDRAIVSDIPGTTRDTIEDTLYIGSYRFRLIDTAGIRNTDDTIERLGIDRTRKAIQQAAIVIWLIDPTQSIDAQIAELESFKQEAASDSIIIPLYSKSKLSTVDNSEIPAIDALSGEGIDTLTDLLTASAQKIVYTEADVIVTNARHYEALTRGADSLQRLREGMAMGLSADLLAQDLRETLHHIGTITGAITTDDLLQTVFSRFCIGK